MIAASVFSQDVYPKLIVIDRDTLVLFTPDHVDKMNITFLELDKANEINITYIDEINLCQDKILILTEQNNNCKEKGIILVDIAEEKEKQIEILASENKKQEKKIKLLKKLRNLYAIGGVVLGSVGTYYLSQIFN